jgi:Phosphotransferase enzyme family
VSQTASHIAERYAEWAFIPHITRQVFADPSPEAVASALDDFCRRVLGSGIEQSELFDASIGSVHGLRLHDGRRVVLKVHGSRASVGFLEAVQEVQRVLAADGFPAPQPLVGPTEIGRGVGVVESFVDAVEPADAHDPSVRRALAAGLADLVGRCRPLVRLDGLRENSMVPDPERLWPAPHDGRFDFDATSAGAEWIDRVGSAARPVRDRPVGDVVVGHTDWRVEHVRFERGRLTAVYDWDSLSIEREPLLVGAAAHAFMSNWEEPDRRQFPTLAEAMSFVSDYEAARGRPFEEDEHAVARASLAYTMAYTARCEHSDALTDMGRRPDPLPSPAEVPPLTARAFLAAHAAELLGADVGAVPGIASG